MADCHGSFIIRKVIGLLMVVNGYLRSTVSKMLSVQNCTRKQFSVIKAGELISAVVVHIDSRV